MDLIRTVTELWREIDAWFDEHGAVQNIRARRRGAPAEAIERLETKLGLTLPTDYRTSLSIHDGGGDFDSYAYLSVAEVAHTWTSWHGASKELASRGIVADGAHHRWWEDSWIPFACDSCGNLVCVDGASHRVIMLETQDAQGAFISATGFVDWLSDYRNRLMNGELEVDDEGFVGEPLVRPSVTPVDDFEPIELDSETSDAVESAIRGNNLEQLRTLLTEVEPNSLLTYSRTMLGTAAEAGHLRIVTFLLERGEDVNAGQSRGDRTPLFWATWGQRNKVDVVRYLLERGAHVNALTRYDGTVLHSAVMWDQLDALELLLRHGADSAIKDAYGKTALDKAKGGPSERVLSDPAA